MNLKELIDEFPDFPKRGILFRDFGPVLLDPEALESLADGLSARFSPDDVDLFAGIESRGFILACAMALKHKKGMVLVRKAGKLPGKTARASYTVEYGQDTMEIQRHAIAGGQRVMICDDLLATGGTAAAAASLVEEVGGSVAGFLFIIELAGLGGAERIKGYCHESLVEYRAEE